MKLQEARTLIKTTFESPFDKGRFTLFIKNLLKDAYEEKTFLQTGGQLPQAFAELIRKMERIGKYEDGEGNIIDILAVELKKGRSIEWARTTQRNFIRRYLNGSRGGELKDAALVAFYSEGSEDWRFSLIKMQYSLEKKTDELTPAKRFSFLVGKDERSHTAQNQLAGLLTLDSVPTLVEIESSFNIETVTKEFFEKYKQLFLDLNDHIEKEIKKSKHLREELESKNIDAASFTKKLLGQIVFLYFLQKKGWLGVPKNENWNKGDKQYLRTLLDEAVAEKKNFFSDYLVYLFYEALATEHRGGSDPSYYARLNCRIPFLNGGLFEADYDWEKIDISIPNKLFTNTDKTEQGDIGTGVLDVFDRYNFTVKEDEPLEKQVAVDPEMLGKVFENLLEVKDRKSKGAFYTPREIVHYMCQESLIAYLDTSINGEATSFQKIDTEQTDMFGNKARKGQLPMEVEHGRKIIVERKDIEKFIREGTAAIEHDELKEAGKLISKDYALPESIRNYAKELDKALANIRICDPAIGSGAFPVGMMNEIVKAREILAIYLPNAKDHTAYELKRHAIQECIYGVDIEHSAIDIAKLRLWLSLIVDEDDFYKIKPLPNLDYKIVRGNSLIGMPDNSFRDVKLEDEIKELEDELFDERDKDKKDKLRSKIEKKIRQLLDSAEQFSGYKVDFDFKVFFSKVFREKKGFDIVIGNPPYKIESKSEQIFYKGYSTINCGDLYAYFFERSIKQLLKTNGTLSFITASLYIKGLKFDSLRMYLENNLRLISLEVQGDRVFENVQMPTAVIIGTKSDKKNNDWSFENFIPNNNIIKKIETDTKPLSKISDVMRGFEIGRDQVNSDGEVKFITGSDVSKWAIKKHSFISKRTESEYKKNEDFFKGERILIRETGSELTVIFLDSKLYCNRSLYSIKVRDKKYSSKYLAALLNSSLFQIYYISKFKSDTDLFPKIRIVQVNQLPIKFSENQKRFDSIVDKILSAKEKNPEADISKLEKQIDIMVYHL
ncbi:MAG: TaqI-like C-terminal specificity domain-containing protein [Bacteroidota bacterium]